MTPLPAAFSNAPIAHRALHDAALARPENSAAAMRAAVAAGYGIEIDVQLSRDKQAMVFHDYQLDRLTGETGAIQLRDAEALGQIELSNSADHDCIPTLEEVLKIVAGQVPLLVEIKDQDGALGPNTGALEHATAEILRPYHGPVAVMSFNPHAVATFKADAPEVPVGLVTGNFASESWGLVPEARLIELRSIPDYDRIGASFISHRATNLDNPHVARIRDKGGKIFCWTIRSVEEELQARAFAENITFEGYTPK